MKNRILFTALLSCCCYLLMAQSWRVELDKHQQLPFKEIVQNMEAYFDSVGSTKENKYHHWMRYRDFTANHLDENGRQFSFIQTNEALIKVMERQITLNNTQNSRHFHGSWVSVNPQNFQTPTNAHPANGRINCVAAPPSSSVLYAGTATGGVWKSNDNGATWDSKWDGMAQTGVSSIIVDNTAPNHILALSGDADSKFIPSNGVYHSFDYGNSWLSLYNFPTSNQTYGYKIIQSKSMPSNYYIVAEKSGRDIVRFDASTNPIVTYLDNSPEEGVFDIEYLPNSNNILFAAGKEGLFKRTEPSTNWSPVTTGLPSGTFTRTAIAVTPANPNVIYYSVARVATSTTPKFYGLYKSSNGGTSFSTVYDTTDLDIFTDQCSYNFTLDVDPLNEQTVFVGTTAFRKSINGGASFILDHTGLHADIHNSFFLNGNQYVCTDGGISARPTQSTPFSDINNGLICTQFYDIDVSNNKFVGGTQDNGTMYWNLGDPIGIRKLGADGLDCQFDPKNDNVVYASTQNSKYKSTNFGNTQNQLFAAEWHDPITFATDNDNKIISHAIDELKISTNNGFSWSSTNIFSSVNNVPAMSQCKDNPNVFYLAKPDSIARSDNFNNAVSQITWDTCFIFNSNFVLKDILVHPDTCNEVYTVFSGYGLNRVTKSTNSGNNFSGYSEGLENIPTYCIAYDHVNGDGFYIGTEIGVYYRNKSMSEWIPFATYLPRVPVYDIKVTNNYVYAGTYGRGLWRSEGYKACKNSLTLTQANDPTNGKPSGHQIHKVSNTITSNRIIQGYEGTKVHYQAGNYIDLLDGFFALTNIEFVAKAAGCLE